MNTSEKYEFVNWDDYPQYFWENTSHVPNHQPDMNPAINIHSQVILFGPSLELLPGKNGCRKAKGNTQMYIVRLPYMYKYVYVYYIGFISIHNDVGTI